MKSKDRYLALFGIGLGYKPNIDLEVYGNISQNYRSINFTDLAVVNPNLVVDSLLQDERGFNADLGFRGRAAKGKLVFDASVFYLDYKNRIGVGEIVVDDPSVGGERAVAYRTNIGDARIVGLEAYTELQIMREQKEEKKRPSISVFANFSLLYGQYVNGATSFVGNKVESIPPVSFKTGVNVAWQDFKLAYQFNFVSEHFSDATNAEFVSDATRGIIPSYQVQDLSLSYSIGIFDLQAGVNNLLDTHYFTRRAVAYPGPGIIPSDGRSFYGGIALRL